MIKEVRMLLLREKQRQIREGFNKVEIDGYKDFIFVTRGKNPYISEVISAAIKRIYTEYNKKERKAAKKEGREPVIINHFTAHNLRHTFATRLCENETNLKAIQEIMGHNDIKTTMNIYAEATKEAKQNSMDKLEGKLGL